jgi:hypothetical protein
MIAILIRDPGALNNKGLLILFSKGFRPSCQVDLAGGRGNELRNNLMGLGSQGKIWHNLKFPK